MLLQHKTFQGLGFERLSQQQMNHQHEQRREHGKGNILQEQNPIYHETTLKRRHQTI